MRGLLSNKSIAEARKEGDVKTVGNGEAKDQPPDRSALAKALAKVGKVVKS